MSVPGSCNGSGVRVLSSRRSASRGFTLIEVLVVVTIMAIVTALVVVRLENSDRHRLSAAAERMAILLEGARDEAIASGRSVAISSDGEGCQFWQMDDERGEWLAFPAHDTLVAQRLADPVRWLGQTVNDRSRPLGERIVFPPDGVIEPFSVMLAAGPARAVLEMDVMGQVGVKYVDTP